MGYTTTFKGSFRFDRPLAAAHAAYLRQFAESRRMRRDPAKCERLADPHRLAVGLPVGPEGGYYVGDCDRFASQIADGSVLDHNRPPEGQPGLWCQWVPDEGGDALVWDEGEKFYRYIEWLRYLIEHFLKPWGYVLNGRVTWEGEDSDDVGVLTVTDNVVSEAS
jgi:hypothetical protein